MTTPLSLRAFGEPTPSAEPAGVDVLKRRKPAKAPSTAAPSKPPRRTRGNAVPAAERTARSRALRRIAHRIEGFAVDDATLAELVARGALDLDKFEQDRAVALGLAVKRLLWPGEF